MSTVDFEVMKALCRAAPARFDWGTRTWRVAGAPGIALIDTLAGAGFAIERHDGAVAVRQSLRDAASRHYFVDTPSGTELDFADGRFVFRSEAASYESACDALAALLLLAFNGPAQRKRRYDAAKDFQGQTRTELEALWLECFREVKDGAKPITISSSGYDPDVTTTDEQVLSLAYSYMGRAKARACLDDEMDKRGAVDL